MYFSPKRLFVSFAFLVVCISSPSGKILPSKPRQMTIDTELQQLGQRLLKNKQGSIVAIEPSTGRVLCLVSTAHTNDSVNRAISTSYSPGSTFKTVQALQMLSEGTLKPEKTYPCNKGFYHKNIHIGCHPHRTHLALVDALSHSCNSYFCKTFQEMVDNRKVYPTKRQAINTWDRYMRSFGLGSPLGIDMPDESGGEIPNANSLNKLHGAWNGTTIMWVGMGQGEVLTTPLQLCNLSAIIANRGHYYIPHIYEDKQGKPLHDKFTKKQQTLAKPEAFDVVIKGMRACVASGTASAINTRDYEICGKTGTAENEGDDHSIFMAFAPMKSPKIAVSVYVENGGFGGELAAPMAALIMEKYIKGKLSDAHEARVEKWSSRSMSPQLKKKKETAKK